MTNLLGRTEYLQAMKEVFRRKEISASESEIKQAVEGWWSYLDRKMQVDPRLAGGIIPRIIDYPSLEPQESGRTIKLSLVDKIAPELSGLAYIVGSVKYPHIYIEGTKSPDIVVKFSELYVNASEEKPIFRADSHNKFPRYLKNNGISPNRFLLHITSDNEKRLGKRIAIYDGMRIADLVFLTNTNNAIRVYTLQGAWHSLYLPSLKRALPLPKIETVGQATRSEINIIKMGFEHALSALG